MSLFRRGQHVLYKGRNRQSETRYAIVMCSTIAISEETQVQIQFASGYEYEAFARNLKKISEREYAEAIAKRALGLIT